MEIIAVCVVTAVNSFAMGYMALGEAMRKLMSGLHLCDISSSPPFAR